MTTLKPQPPENFKLRHPYGFEHFDPVNGTIPQFLLVNELESIMVRARRLLAHRSREEINFIAASVNWILDQMTPLELDRLLAASTAQNQPDEHDEGTLVPITAFDDTLNYDSSILLRHHANFDIAGQRALPDATWTDYFAVLSLAQVNAACEEIHYRFTERRWNINTDDSQRALLTFALAQYALMAMESVCVAEAFQRQAIHEKATVDKFKTAHRTRVKLQTQFAAIHRHEDSRIVLLKFHQFWQERQQRGEPQNSYRNAARLFMAHLTKDKRLNLIDHILPENRIDFLSEGLSQFLRGKRSLEAPPG